jgi:hypothetical protein
MSGAGHPQFLESSTQPIPFRMATVIRVRPSVFYFDSCKLVLDERRTRG